MRKEYYRSAGEIVLLPFERIIPHPGRYDDTEERERLSELAASIAENGLLDPIAVKYGGEDYYEIVAGERRYRACVAVGMTEIPCVLFPADDFACAVYSLVENQQHRPLHWLQEAEMMQNLLCHYQISVFELSNKLCKSVGYINKKLKLLSLSEEVRRLLTEQNFGEDYAAALLTAPEQDRQALLEQIAEGHYGISEAVELIEKTKKAGQAGNSIMIFKDITVFHNTVEHAVEMMNRAGIRTDSEKTETDACVEYTIRIQKTG